MNPMKLTSSLERPALTELPPPLAGEGEGREGGPRSRAPFAGLLVLLAIACGPVAQDGVTPLPLGQDVALAFGRQRLLLPIDPSSHYRVRLAPKLGDFALLVASVCTLDPHRRVDEGDSHCLDQEVTTAPDGSSEAAIAPPEHRFNALVMRIYSEGPSAGPVTLRVDVAQ
jgi:hypothetical protein